MQKMIQTIWMPEDDDLRADQRRVTASEDGIRTSYKKGEVILE